MTIIEWYDAVMSLLAHSSLVAQLASKDPKKLQIRTNQLKSGTGILQDGGRPSYVSGLCHGAAVGRLDRLHDYLFWMFSFLGLD